MCCWEVVRGMIMFLHWDWKPRVSVRLLPAAVKLLHTLMQVPTVPCPYSTLLLPWICTRGWFFYWVLPILKQASKHQAGYLSFIGLGYQCILGTVCNGKNCFTRPGPATRVLGSHSLVQNMPWAFFFLRRKGRGRKRPEYFTTIVCHTKKHRREQQLLVTTEKFVRWVFANQCNRTVCSNLLDSKEEKIFQCFHLKDAWYLYQHYSLLSPSAQRSPT